MTHAEAGQTACTKVDERLQYAVARIVQGDTANATQEINHARDHIAVLRRELDLAMVEEDNLRNAAYVFAALIKGTTPNERQGL